MTAASSTLLEQLESLRVYFPNGISARVLDVCLKASGGYSATLSNAFTHQLEQLGRRERTPEEEAEWLEDKRAEYEADYICGHHWGNA